MLFRKLAPVALVVSIGSAYADPGQSGWIATPNRAYAVMPATSLTDGKVGKVSWSPDGEHLLIGERPVTTSREQVLRFDGSGPAYGPLELLGWDRRFHQIRRLWGTEDPSATIDDVAWLRTTSSALVTVRWVVRDGPQGAQRPIYGVLSVDVGTGKFRWVPGMEQLVARPRITPSPTHPISAAVFSDNPQADDNSPENVVSALSDLIGKGEIKINFTIIGSEDQAFSVGNGNVVIGTALAPPANNFWTLDAGGSVLHAIKVEKPIQLHLVWNLDGSGWFLVDTDPKTKQPILARLTDQGRLEPTFEQQYSFKESANDLEVAPVSALAKLGKSQVNYTNLWLRSRTTVDHGEMLLSGDGEWPELSPTNGGVFYIDGGVAMVRELIPLTAGQQRSARDAPETPNRGQASVLSGSIIRVWLNANGRTKPTQP